MYRQHFGLRQPPLGKELTELWDDGALAQLDERFQWLLQSPGVGLLTGEAGVGKTAALRSLTGKLNPHRYQVNYHAETDFGRLDLPAFLNFAFDSRDLISVWLVGHPALAHTLERAPYAALASRIQARVQLKPVQERERFAELILHGLKHAGCTHTLLADSGMEILRQASKGLPRHAGRILRTAMRLAVPRALNHLPDELLQLAIEELR